MDDNRGNPIDVRVGARVRSRRETLCVGRADLAAALQVSETELSQYESGRARIPAGILQRLGKTLRTSIAFFFDHGFDAALAPFFAKERTHRRRARETRRDEAVVERPIDGDLLIEQHVTPTFVLDVNGKVAIWNRACESLTGLNASEVLGTREHWRGFYAHPRPCLADLILEDRIETVSELYDVVSDVRDSREALAAENWCIMPVNRRRLYVAIEAALVRDGEGKITGAIQTLRDLTAMKSAETKYRSLAGSDALTGIANRRTFEDTLASEWRRAMRAGAHLSLLMIDVDHFKQFNDTFGHPQGDFCLQKIAGELVAQTHRAGDFPARYGGEEFAVVLPATDKAGAANIAERIRAAVERLGMDHPRSGVAPVVTVSIGTATVAPTGYDRVEKLICFADIALYRAKAQGRNRVWAFDDAPPCDVARNQPTAGVEIPVIDSNDCASCRSGAPKGFVH